MDLNLLRSIVTVLAFVSFVAIVVWAWSSKRREAFETAARLALDDDRPDVPPHQK